MDGQFIISLDFELLWGVRDRRTPETYGRNLMGVREAVPRMLQAFEKHKVSATWATVGMLFAPDKQTLLAHCPTRTPGYAFSGLSPYLGHLDTVGKSEATDKYHFASELIDLIRQYPGQEIATHTFSHYYCLEEGQTKEHFREDLMAAQRIAKDRNIELSSLVFPRNQFNDDYLAIVGEVGITSYRGNEESWIYRAQRRAAETPVKRAVRLLDAYFNLSGHNTYPVAAISKRQPYNFPSSRFLRPYSRKLGPLEGLRLNRIRKGMTHAARKGEVYHLWWHPHNFGVNQQENFDFLDRILSHYTALNTRYNFRSTSMRELSQRLSRG